MLKQRFCRRASAALNPRFAPQLPRVRLRTSGSKRHENHRFASVLRFRSSLRSARQIRANFGIGTLATGGPPGVPIAAGEGPGLAAVAARPGRRHLSRSLLTSSGSCHNHRSSWLATGRLPEAYRKAELGAVPSVGLVTPPGAATVSPAGTTTGASRPGVRKEPRHERRGALHLRSQGDARRLSKRLIACRSQGT